MSIGLRPGLGLATPTAASIGSTSAVVIARPVHCLRRGSAWLRGGSESHSYTLLYTTRLNGTLVARMLDLGG